MCRLLLFLARVTRVEKAAAFADFNTCLGLVRETTHQGRLQLPGELWVLRCPAGVQVDPEQMDPWWLLVVWYVCPFGTVLGQCHRLS